MIPSAEPGGVRSERSTTPHAAVVDLHVSLVGRRHLADQIVDQVTAAIRDGALVADSPLPSSRELADRLAISRSTVVSAYDRLMADGLLRSELLAGARPAPGQRRSTATARTPVPIAVR